jgi:TetR/AcrR family transcriptional repressor of uid operon
MPTTASRGPGRPPAAKADETRKRIVDAARLVFSERGYDGATFQAIALCADLTRPAINHYFSSKRALYRTVLEQCNALVIAAGVEYARRETGLMARLSEFISFTLRANADHPCTSAFLVTNVLETQRHPELTENDFDAVRVSLEFLNWAVLDAVESGEIADDIDVSALSETLLALLCGVGFYAGYLRSNDIGPVTKMLGQLVAGALWQSKT